ERDDRRDGVLGREIYDDLDDEGDSASSTNSNSSIMSSSLSGGMEKSMETKSARFSKVSSILRRKSYSGAEGLPPLPLSRSTSFASGSGTTMTENPFVFRGALPVDNDGYHNNDDAITRLSTRQTLSDSGSLRGEKSGYDNAPPPLQAHPVVKQRKSPLLFLSKLTKRNNSSPPPEANRSRTS